MSEYKIRLQELISQSWTTPVAIFKHSTACPISARAATEIRAFQRENAEIPTEQIVVQKERSFSDFVAAKLEVKHETPQVLLLANGKVAAVYNHFDIRKNRLEAHIRAFRQGD